LVSTCRREPDAALRGWPGGPVINPAETSTAEGDKVLRGGFVARSARRAA
jgi:hypothetical protein